MRLHIRFKILGQFVLVFLVFMGLIFFWVLPSMKKAIFKEKQTQIQAMVQTVYSMMENYYNREQKGEFTREEAQKRCLDRIKVMRYGSENKDYFWVNDFGPKMLMHPFATQLDGKDLSDYKDKQGKNLFMEMVKVCKDKGEGYVDYMWQWKDDKNRIEPKTSFVKAFAPWGWIVGTGVYVNDVDDQVAGLRNNLLLAIIPVILLLSLMLYLPCAAWGAWGK